MKIVIAGIGKFGDYLTRQLAKENNEITVIDINFTGKEALINNEDIFPINSKIYQLREMSLIDIMNNNKENIQIYNDVISGLEMSRPLI